MNRLRYVWLILSAAMIAAFVTLSWAYLASPIFFDHVEAHLASVSWYFLHGMPLYNRPGDGEVYMLPYGPFPHLVQGLVQVGLGPSIFSSKLVGVLAINGALLALYGLFRKYASRAVAIFATGFVAAYWIGVGYNLLASRADTFMMLFCILGFWAATSPSWTGALLLGLCLGVGLNVKIHAPLYFLPVACFALRQGMGWKKLVVAGILANALYFLPYVFFPNLSLGAFVGMMKVMARQGRLLDLFLKNMVWLTVVSAPVLAAIGLSLANDAVLTRKTLRDNRQLIIGILIATPLLLVIASKNGAGAPHLLPLMTAIVFLGVQLLHGGLDLKWRPKWIFPVVYTTVSIVLLSAFGYGLYKVKQAYDIIGVKQSTEGRAIESDLLDILQRRGADHLILMGVGDKPSFPATYFRDLLIFHGMPMGIAPQTVMDWKMVGIPEPDLGRLREVLAQRYPGKSIVWLIPKGTVPFSYVFNDQFRASFGKAYKLVESTPHFDLYYEQAASP